MDFSGVLAGLSIVAIVAAIVGAGALLAMPDFARWCTNKVAGFFSDQEDDDQDDDVLDLAEVDPDTADDDHCRYLGYCVPYDNGVCGYCGWPVDDEDGDDR